MEIGLTVFLSNDGSAVLGSDTSILPALCIDMRTIVYYEAKRTSWVVPVILLGWKGTEEHHI